MPPQRNVKVEKNLRYTGWLNTKYPCTTKNQVFGKYGHVIGCLKNTKWKVYKMRLRRVQQLKNNLGKEEQEE